MTPRGQISGSRVQSALSIAPLRFLSLRSPNPSEHRSWPANISSSALMTAQAQSVRTVVFARSTGKFHTRSGVCKVSRCGSERLPEPMLPSSSRGVEPYRLNSQHRPCRVREFSKQEQAVQHRRSSGRLEQFQAAVAFGRVRFEERRWPVWAARLAPSRRRLETRVEQPTGAMRKARPGSEISASRAGLRGGGPRGPPPEPRGGGARSRLPPGRP
jgi:hypothetical protein